MSFISIPFFIFFILVLLIGFVIQKFFPTKIYNLFLLLCNYIFYSYYNYKFSFLLLIVTLIIFICAKKNNKVSFYIGIISSLFPLLFFKYSNFILSNLHLNILDIAMPLGISFYTFEAISYLVDVKRGKYETEDDFVIFALYLSFFPNIASGPIERANNLLVQFKQDRKINSNNIKIGIQIIVFGLFKKMVIADRLSVFVDDIYHSPKAFNWLTLLLAIFSYSIQIYMDFSGYSDIAVGCAKCLGFDFKKNFDLPYISYNLTQFWRKWHISLSTWFKDYVYIPLGGNRKGNFRKNLNLTIVMSLSGLWHGANWTYILWGFVNGVLLCIEKVFNKKNNIFTLFINYILISFIWILFRASSLANSLEIYKAIFTLQDGIKQPYIWSFVAFIFIIIYLILRKYRKDLYMDYYPIQDLNTIKGLTIFFVFVGLLICLAYTNTNPFVYFQF